MKFELRALDGFLDTYGQETKMIPLMTSWAMAVQLPHLNPEAAVETLKRLVHLGIVDGSSLHRCVDGLFPENRKCEDKTRVALLNILEST